MGNSESNTNNRGGARRPPQPPGARRGGEPVQAPSSGASGGHGHPPGAFKMPGQAKNQRFYVTIPRGAKAGVYINLCRRSCLCDRCRYNVIMHVPCICHKGKRSSMCFLCHGTLQLLYVVTCTV